MGMRCNSEAECGIAAPIQRADKIPANLSMDLAIMRRGGVKRGPWFLASA